MWKNVAAVLAGAASAALAAALGFLQHVDPSGVAGTSPLTVALVGAGIAAVVRVINLLISKL